MCCDVLQETLADGETQTRGYDGKRQLLWAGRNSISEHEGTKNIESGRERKDADDGRVLPKVFEMLHRAILGQAREGNEGNKTRWDQVVQNLYAGLSRLVSAKFF